MSNLAFPGLLMHRTKTNALLSLMSHIKEHNYSRCGNGKYVGKIKCSGSRCDNIQLGCYNLDSSCRYEGTGEQFVEIENNQWWYGNEGEVLVGIRCKDSWCGKLMLGMQQVKKI